MVRHAWIRQLLFGLVVGATSTLALQLRSAASGGQDTQSQSLRHSSLVVTTTTAAAGRNVFMGQYKNDSPLSLLGNVTDDAWLATHEVMTNVTNVLCGSHYAASCHECPHGHGAEWCGGECHWNGQAGCIHDHDHDSGLYDSTTTTTTVFVAVAHHSVNYTVLPGEHCGGTPILTWPGGGFTSYGKGYASNLAGCELTCAVHAECSGFTVRHSDHMCSLWSMGELVPYVLEGHDCHKKDGGGSTMEEKLVQKMSIENVDFTALHASPTAMAAFETECAKVMAQNAGVDASSVVVSLSAGSVSVRAEISPPPGMDCEQLQTTLGQSESLGSRLVSAISENVKGMDSFTTGPMVAGAIVSGVETVVVLTAHPCSHQDGSSGSNHYPCLCGGNSTCLTDEICDATTQQCMGVRLLMAEAAVVEMAQRQFEQKIRETRRMMGNLTTVVGKLSQEITDAYQMAADIGTIARGNAEGLRQQTSDGDEMDRKVSKINGSLKLLEKKLVSPVFANVSDLVKGAAKNYTWAKIAMQDLTDLPMKVAIGEQARDAYKEKLRKDVNRTMTDVLGKEIDDIVHLRQETFHNYSNNVFRNRTLRGDRNDEGGGVPLPPRVPVEQIKPCHLA